MPRMFECMCCGRVKDARDGCQDFEGGLVCNACIENGDVVECQWCNELTYEKETEEDDSGRLVCKNCTSANRADYMHDQIENYIDMEQDND